MLLLLTETKHTNLYNVIHTFPAYAKLIMCNCLEALVSIYGYLTVLLNITLQKIFFSLAPIGTVIVNHESRDL
jgi:hypothetical protein